MPLTLPNKLYEIAKKDVAKYLKVSIDTFPKDIPDEWILNNFIKYEWGYNFIISCLDTEEKMKSFVNCAITSNYYREYFLDNKYLLNKRLPEIKFDF